MAFSDCTDTLNSRSFRSIFTDVQYLSKLHKRDDKRSRRAFLTSSSAECNRISLLKTPHRCRKVAPGFKELFSNSNVRSCVWIGSSHLKCEQIWDIRTSKGVVSPRNVKEHCCWCSNLCRSAQDVLFSVILLSVAQWTELLNSCQKFSALTKRIKRGALYDKFSTAEETNSAARRLRFSHITCKVCF